MHSASLTSCRGSNSGFSSGESVKSAVQSSGSGLAPSPMKTIKKILIAHHDAGMRRRLVMLFAAAGFDVRSFASP